jgi:hypothetical protein
MTARRSFVFLAALVVAVPRASHAQWQHFTGPGDGEGNAVAALPGGDVVVAGSTSPFAVVGTVTRLAGGTGAEVWRKDLSGDITAFNEMLAVAANDSATAVFVGGRVRNAATMWDFTVAKLAAADGSTVWRREIDGGGPETGVGFDQAVTLAVDPAGDVVAGGGLVEGTVDSFTVVKLAGADGTMMWMHELDAPSYGLARRVTVDGAGDVLAVGTTMTGGFTVVKLSGATGDELWRYGTSGEGYAVTVDAAGDVVAAGQGFHPPQNSLLPTVLLVVKLAGLSGAELWRAEVVGTTLSSGGANDVTVDAAGDVIAGGGVNVTNAANSDFIVLKLAGATGLQLWQRAITAPCCYIYQHANRVAVDPAGDVIAGGQLARPTTSPGPDYDFGVMKFAGATGATVWARQLGAGRNDQAEDLVVDASGDVIASGAFSEDPAAFSGPFTTVKLTATTGSDYLLSGRRLAMSDAGPAARGLTITSKARIVPAPGLHGGTDPTLGGATLEVVNPTTSETATIALPAAGWRGVGSPPGSKGYRYDDHFAALGPCSQALVSSTRFSVRCGGAGIGFSLNEPSQGSLVVRFSMGSEGLRRCMLFGGSVKRDIPGLFIAVKAPEPVTCP